MNVQEFMERVSLDIEKYYQISEVMTRSHEHKDYVHEAILKIERLYRHKGISNHNIDALMWLTIRSCWLNSSEKIREYPREIDEDRIADEPISVKNEEAFLQKLSKTVKSIGGSEMESQYYWKLYQYIYIEGLSMRELSRRTGITIFEISRALKCVRDKIAETLREDYEKIES